MSQYINILSFNEGTKLASDPKSLTGIEFVNFAESQPDIWPKVHGTIVVHAKFGSGTIESVEERQNLPPLLNIQFSLETSLSPYNLDAFKTDKYFSNIQISDELLNLLAAWNEKNAIEKNQVAVEKAAQTKIILEKEMASKKKKYYTEPATGKIVKARPSGGKSILDKLGAAYTAEAMSLTPKQLEGEIIKMQHETKSRPTEKLNIRLTTFQRVHNSREDCGPLFREIRVPSTS